MSFRCPCSECPMCGFVWDLEDYDHPVDGLGWCPKCQREWWAHCGPHMDGRHIRNEDELRRWDWWDSDVHRSGR